LLLLFIVRESGHIWTLRFLQAQPACPADSRGRNRAWLQPYVDGGNEDIYPASFKGDLMCPPRPNEIRA